MYFEFYQKIIVLYFVHKIFKTDFLAQILPFVKKNWYSYKFEKSFIIAYIIYKIIEHKIPGLT